MKRMLLATGLMVFMAGPALMAQTIELKATIPFRFQVGDKQLPPGLYSLQNQGTMLLIRDAKGQTRAVDYFTLPATRIARVKESVLVFKRYGTEYFLANVWTAGASGGRTVRPSQREREFASGGHPHPDAAITVAAR